MNKVGLKTGDIVCLFSPNSRYYHEIVFALQCAAIVCSAANAAYTKAELRHQLHDSNSTALIVHPSILEVALQASAAAGWSEAQQRDRIILAVRKRELKGKSDYRCLDDIEGEQLLEPVKIRNPKKTVAFLGFSSGTTSAAKGVQSSHYNMTSVLAQLAPMEASPKDVALANLPLSASVSCKHADRAQITSTGSLSCCSGQSSMASRSSSCRSVNSTYRRSAMPSSGIASPSCCSSRRSLSCSPATRPSSPTI